MNKEKKDKPCLEAQKEDVLVVNKDSCPENEIMIDGVKCYEADPKITDITLREIEFDENKVLKEQPFSFIHTKNMIGFGLSLPAYVDEKDKDGNVIGTKQVRKKYVVTSDKQLLPANRYLEKSHKIRMINIPKSYPNRFTPIVIKKWIKGEKKGLSFKQVFEKIKNRYEKYLYFREEEFYSIRAIWDIGTYFFMLFDYYPLAELRGIKGSAKNKIMDVSRPITFNATREMTNPTESTLFRLTDERRPTKYIDEAERLFNIIRGKVEADSRVELINSSYKKTGSVPRQEKQGNKFVTMWYSTYSPTMLASINGLFGATEDRALIQITSKAPKSDSRMKIQPNEKDKINQEIRDDLYILALEAWKEVKMNYDIITVPKELTNRDIWIWKPILTIARLIDEETYKEIANFAVKASRIKEITDLHEGSKLYKILKAMRYIIFDCEDNPVYANAIREHIEGKEDYKPANKTICSELDRIGFMPYKDRKNNGTCYGIDKDLFNSIISTVCPNLVKQNINQSSTSSSQSSFTSLNNKNEDRENLSQYHSEDRVKQMKQAKNVGEASEANEANEADNDKVSKLRDGQIIQILHEHQEGLAIGKLCHIFDIPSKQSDLLYKRLLKMQKKGEVYQDKALWFTV